MKNIFKTKRKTVFLSITIPAILLILWEVASLTFPKFIKSPAALALTKTTQVYYTLKKNEFIAIEKKLPKQLNILVVGLDSRLVKGGSNADAIHLVSINTESMHATITSIPRDTYTELPNADSTQQKMTYARNFLGRKGFIHRVQEFLHVPKIHYSLEVTFSQVMGILELLGYDDPGKAMHFLRNRKSFRLGDIQRSHNQAMFMKRSLERNFNLLAGASGDVLLSVVLNLIDTDLPKDVAQTIIYKLYKSGFPNGEERIELAMKPDIDYRFAELAPTPDEMDYVNDSLYNTMSDHFKEDEIGRPDANKILDEAINRAKHCKRNPRGVIQVLQTAYNQRGWLQISNPIQRAEARDEIAGMLSNAYHKIGKEDVAQKILDYIEGEKKLFRPRGFWYWTPSAAL